MIRALITLTNISWVVIAITGLGLSLWGYRQGYKKTAFLLFTIYFAASLYACTLNRPVMRWLASKRTHAITQEMLDQYAQMHNELQEIYLKYPMVEPGTTVRYINFPFGQALLVLGVWILVKKGEES